MGALEIHPHRLGSNIQLRRWAGIGGGREPEGELSVSGPPKIGSEPAKGCGQRRLVIAPAGVLARGGPVPGPGQRRPDLQRSSVQIGPYPNRPGDGRGLEVWLTPPFGSPGGLGQDQLVQRQVRDRPTQPQTLIFQRLQPFDLIVLCRRTPPSSGNTLSPSPQSFSLLRSSTCTDRSGHQPDAAWRRSL